MPKQEGAIETEASRDEVWEVVSDPSRLGDWTTIHRGFEGEVPSRVEEGTTFTQELEVAGQEFSVEWAATEVEKPSRMVWNGKGPTGTSAQSVYELSDSDGGTKFSYSIEFDPPGGKLGDVAAKP